MNKARRNALAKALPLIAQAQALLAEAKGVVEGVRDDEQEVYDGMSEGQQGGDMGDAMQTAISDMEEAIDGIGSISLKDIVDGIERAADRSGEEIAPASLTEAEAEARRQARLPDWAKRRIAAAEARAEAADARMADVFAERDEKDAKQAVIDDYGSPVRGRVIPSEQIAFPGLGIRVYADRHGRGLAIDGTDMGVVNIVPQSGNSVILRIDRRF